MKEYKITLFRSGAIGDVICTLPLVYALRERFGDQLNLDYFTASYMTQLLRYTPAIDNLYPVNFKTNVWNLFKSYLQFKKYKTDILLNLQPHWKSNLILSGINTETTNIYQKAGNPIETVWMNFAKTYFSKEDLKQIKPEKYLPLFKIPQNEIDELWANMPFGKNKNQPVIALVPSVGRFRPHRAWPIENWVSLIQMLGNHYEILLIGGGDDKLICDQIMTRVTHQISTVYNLVNQFSLVDLAKIYSKVNLVIGGDTGPIHLAAAMKAKTLALFGPTSKERHHPIGGHSIRGKFECNVNCNDKVCTATERNNCMRHITPVHVHSLIQELL